MTDDTDHVPLITNTTNNSIRRKQIPRWKRILCCGIYKIKKHSLLSCLTLLIFIN